VKSISYSHETGIFTLKTSTGIKKARNVVFAAGHATILSLPPDSPFYRHSKGSIAHAFEKPYHRAQTSLLPPNVLQKVSAKKTTNVVVVGGGLSSAQISALVSKAGVTKVWHLMRGSLKVKHFDLDISWVGIIRTCKLLVCGQRRGEGGDAERGEGGRINYSRV
jgi:uncharacterized NAD(P)/FAD-binding protein YdhS